MLSKQVFGISEENRYRASKAARDVDRAVAVTYLLTAGSRLEAFAGKTKDQASVAKQYMD